MSEMEQHDQEFRDHELRARFAALREREGASAPPFARVLHGRPSRVARRWRQPAMALGAAALVVAVVATWRRATLPDASDVPPAFALVAGTMRVPTDYFLDVATTVGADEIPSIPSIGSVDWYPLVSAHDPIDRPITTPMNDSRRRN